MLTASNVNPGTDSFAYKTGTNRLASLTTGAGTRTFGYAARGNLAGETRANATSVATGYDGYARLASYTRDDVGTLGFVYNGRNDRVAMTGGANGTRAFVYAPDGRGLGEYGTSAADVRAEYVWLTPDAANDNGAFGGDDGAGGYMPLATATPDGQGGTQLRWVHGNHLGVPLVTTDATGTAVTPSTDSSRARAARSPTSTTTATATKIPPPAATSRPIPSG